MVELAYQHLAEEKLFDAICETTKCLPDAIQLLTPCTVGNGWLRIINMGRYAIALFDKYNGEGVRVFLDPPKLEAWPEIKSWFFKLKPKKEQDSQLLMEQIKEAGTNICSVQQVKIVPVSCKNNIGLNLPSVLAVKNLIRLLMGRYALAARVNPRM